jgi:fructose-1,6-bisphosphatase/inositol monophosphatase family enzyme
MNKIYLDFAIEIAKTAGEIIKKNFTLNMKKERKPGISESPVTETDFSINDLIIKKITSTFPEHSIM